MPQEEKPQEVVPGWYLHPDKPADKLSNILGTLAGYLFIFVLEVMFLGTLVSIWLKWVILGWIFKS